MSAQFLIVPFASRSVPETLALGPTLLEVASAEQAICFAATLVSGPAVLLGAHQRRTRVLDIGACETAQLPLFRRTTSGTAAFIGASAIHFSIALPAINALFPDAVNRTIFNRNVRPILRAFHRMGAPAHYFGREHIHLCKRPAIHLAFDATPAGAILLHALLGLDVSFALPNAILNADEIALSRPAQANAVSFNELLTKTYSPENIAKYVEDAFVAQSNAATPTLVNLPPVPLPAFEITPQTPDLIASTAQLLPPAQIPIGWLERAILPSDNTLWLGGDVLAPRHILHRFASRIAASAADESPLLEGVSATDLRALCAVAPAAF